MTFVLTYPQYTNRPPYDMDSKELNQKESYYHRASRSIRTCTYQWISKNFPVFYKV